jgi:hypothetical protein
MATVGRFERPLDAQLAKGLLESAGVASFLVNENVNHLLGAAFRARLRVKTEDEAVARELLAQTAEDPPSAP